MYENNNPFRDPPSPPTWFVQTDDLFQFLGGGNSEDIDDHPSYSSSSTVPLPPNSFSIIMLDPPWSCKSVERSHVYDFTKNKHTTSEKDEIEEISNQSNERKINNTSSSSSSSLTFHERDNFFENYHLPNSFGSSKKLKTKRKMNKDQDDSENKSRKKKRRRKQKKGRGRLDQKNQNFDDTNKEEIFDSLLSLPLSNLFIHDTSKRRSCQINLCLIWITNSPKILNFVLSQFLPKFDFQYGGLIVWSKLVKEGGKLISDPFSNHKFFFL